MQSAMVERMDVYCRSSRIDKIVLWLIEHFSNHSNVVINFPLPILAPSRCSRESYALPIFMDAPHPFCAQAPHFSASQPQPQCYVLAQRSIKYLALSLILRLSSLTITVLVTRGPFSPCLVEMLLLRQSARAATACKLHHSIPLLDQVRIELTQKCSGANNKEEQLWPTIM
jgi:hypothetical protein